MSELKRIALIASPKAPYSDYVVRMCKEYGVDGYYSLKGGYRNYIIRFLRKKFFEYKLPFRELLFGEWKRNLDKYDLIVIIRDRYGEFMANYISENSNARIVLYYMDPYEKSVFWEQLKPNNNCVISSFEIETCKSKGFVYNPLFCFREKKGETKINNDVFFIGTDKGRLKELLKYENIFNGLGLTTYFHICKSPGNIYEDNDNYKYKNKITYPELLKNVRRSKALLEILPEGQNDMTLRGYEAYFFEKKLITNNKNIKDYSFYNKNNIFILGVDNLNELHSFVNSSYLKRFDNEMEKSEFGEWIKKYTNV